MRAESGIDYIELPASDLVATESFYNTVFGWDFTSYGPEYSAFNDGRVDGGFFKTDVQARCATGSVLVVVYAEDLESMRDRVTDHGGSISKDIFDFPGGRRFHFQDPNGNELAVWSQTGA